MILTFFILIFSFLFLFKNIQKNQFFLFYGATMILAAYVCETYLGWRVRVFSKASFMLFILFHLPIINIFTFCAYGKDKRNAKRGEWRIPEIQLHTLEFLGGIIGAIAGQKFFHHKNKKKSYMATFWAMIVMQATIIVYILKHLGIL